MRQALPLLLLLLLAPLAVAQTADEKAATLKFIAALRDPDTGAYAVNPPKAGEKPTPSLRACNGAVKATKYLGGEVTDREKIAKFVLGCFDEKTGTFAEPGGKPDVAITSIGVITAVELGIPREKLKPAMTYLGVNAFSFEEARIAAAAVEAFGVKESGIDFKAWLITAADTATRPPFDAKNGGAREVGSVIAMMARLGRPPRDQEREFVLKQLHDGQRDDGGWGKKGEKASDAETTYRVMRCLMMLKEKPKDVAGLKKFLASCRRPDGGYGVDAAAPSSMSGVYYFATITNWLGGMK